MTIARKVLVLGSGALKIGEAGEFDYSGSQAVKTLKEEGCEVVLVNPNIATIQTSEGLADKVYFLPVTPEFVTEVIRRERPDSLLAAFGGQTALNCGAALWKSGTLRRFRVEVLGSPMEVIEKTEDRALFNAALAEAGLKTPRGIAVGSVEAGLRAADAIGYPVMARAAFALGGRGSGPAHNSRELSEALRRAFSESRQVLVEEYLEGWKEIEYEILRDAADNAIAVCNMENFDPMGIHTGESIVVAPSQTLSNAEYHGLREIALRAVRHLGVVGECNIQYALNPKTGDYRIIEVNARLSRSSALASKATGYPLAAVAAKVCLGRTLPEIRNSITQVTSACFEPALDYLAVKIPRWDLKKFARVSKKIGSEMKSVGEVMALGRSFEEALQKAARMLQVGMYGVVCNANYSFADLEKELRRPTDERLFGIAEALRKGWTVERVRSLTRIDAWFIHKIKNIVDIETRLDGQKLGRLDPGLLREAKRAGFSDKQISLLTRSRETDVRRARKRLGIEPVVKQIDTLAAEYPAKTNYLYLTYHGSEDDVVFGPKADATDDAAAARPTVMVLGSGSYSIGSSVEFDWCCVNAARTLTRLGCRTVMINYNPETVSTDYDVCDRLYFDELSFERVMDIHDKENPDGVIVSTGGQIPNNLALKCGRAGLRILGTPVRSIDRAENRTKFSRLLDGLDVDQPEWRELTSQAQARAFARSIGFPVLIRPSYVLSGAAMSLVFNERDLAGYLEKASRVTPDYPVVISKFIMNAKEIELDAVAWGGEIVISAIVEHIENAGVHSGDATMVLPPQKLYIETIRRVREIGTRIARALRITGPFNIQFLARDNALKVIECNLRASRSFPFVSKVSRTNFIDLAVRAMVMEAGLIAPNTGSAPNGDPKNRTAQIKVLTRGLPSTLDLNHVGVKAPQFSFSRLKGADPALGVEMASTGEAACLGRDVHEAFLKSLIAAGYRLPGPGGRFLLSLGGEKAKTRFLESARALKAGGYKLYATEKTSLFLRKHRLPNTLLHKIQTKREPNIRTLITEGRIDFVLSVPNPEKTIELDGDYRLRRLAVDFSVPLLTNLQVAELFVQSLTAKTFRDLEIRHWDEYRDRRLDS
jgi:carbamoyl-phosphate synthase large subunit